MSDRPPGVASVQDDEPASAAPRAADAGSSLLRDLLRAIVCAVLVSTCVSSPGSLPLFAPLVPPLVAIRWIRARRGRLRFVVMAAGLAMGAAVLSVPALPGSLPAGLAFGGAVAVLLVPVLGAVHVRAARRDDAVLTPDPWPEPTLLHGFTITIGAWSIATIVLLASCLPIVGSVAQVERAQIRESYRPIQQACRSGGALQDQGEMCELWAEQRVQALALVSDHGLDLLGGLAALTVFSSAAVSHLTVLARTRHMGCRVRPRWRLRELEVHWVSAYLMVIGLVAWLVAGIGGAVAAEVRAAGVAVGALGALLVLTQGVGLAAWILTRRPAPVWYRVFLAVGALLAWPITAMLLFGLGMLDLGLHPRRRGSGSGTLPGRGSGG